MGSVRTFDRLVLAGDDLVLPFKGNGTGETWTPTVYQVAANGVVTTLPLPNANIAVGEAINGSGRYVLKIKAGAMTAGCSYYAEVTRTGDNASLGFPMSHYTDGTDSLGPNDGSVSGSVFGKLKNLGLNVGDLSGNTNFKSVAAILGTGFETNNKTLFGYLTDNTDGLAAIKTAVDGVSADLNAEVDSAFSAVGVTTVATALAAIYDAVDEVEGQNADILDRLGGSGAAVSYSASLLSGVTTIVGGIDGIAGEMGVVGDETFDGITAPATQAAALAALWNELVNATYGLNAIKTEVSTRAGNLDTAVGNLSTDISNLSSDVADVSNLIGTSTIGNQTSVFADLKTIYDLVGPRANGLAGSASLAEDLAAIYGEITDAGTGVQALVSAVSDKLGDVGNEFSGIQGLTVTDQAEALRAIYDAVQTGSSPWDDIIDGDALEAGVALTSVHSVVNDGVFGNEAIKDQADAIKTETSEITGKLGTASHDGVSSGQIDSVFGKLALMLSRLDDVKAGRNAALEGSVAASVTPPLSGQVGVRFGLLVSDPFANVAGALEDPDQGPGNAFYHAHVQVLDQFGKNWGPRLYTGGDLSTGLTVRSDASEPTMSAPSVDDAGAPPTPVESWYRMSRMSTGSFQGFIKVQAGDGTKGVQELTILMRVRDSDPTSKPTIFTTSKVLKIVPLWAVSNQPLTFV